MLFKKLVIALYIPSLVDKVLDSSHPFVLTCINIILSVSLTQELDIKVMSSRHSSSHSTSTSSLKSKSGQYFSRHFSLNLANLVANK